MKSQSIVILGEPLQEIDAPTPDPQGSEVLLKVTACGVCHSDVHIHDGYFDLGGGNKLPLSGKDSLPHTMGHEIAGEVVALGPDAKGASVGDKRVVFPWIGCGKCNVCESGEEHYCRAPRSLGVNVPGGYSDHVIVPHAKYLLDYGSLPASLAATYMCSGLTAFGALKKLGTPGPQDKILIVGAGGVGMMGIQFAKALFPSAPLAADIDEGKLEAARAAGASAAYNSKDGSVAKQILAETDGGVFGAIDFVGSEASLNFASSTVRKGGKVVVVGLFGGGFSMPIPMFPLRVITIGGSYVGSLAETKEMMSLVQSGKIDPIPVETRPMTQATQTLEDLRTGSIVGRVVLEP